MQSNFEDYLRAAEDHYLQTPEMNGFKQQVDALQDRLALYETLRDQELIIFQAIADQLNKETFSNSQSDQEKVFTHWMSVLRYSAMAMLTDQPQTLTIQLSWLKGVVGGSEFTTLNQKIGELLHQCLSSILTQDQFALLEPSLNEAGNTLIGKSEPELALLS
ncbi:globin family protein [Acaryochloris marina]|uniref:hypothetical protein n=1 Tax=Acaryochloris marina TaxID=155978 RepID=UPI0021C348FD|nr:hypothetical protein [Acaryochloris marina]BDM83339.1 phycobilisome protein [Acaryochloris marina MBIC10699]